MYVVFFFRRDLRLFDNTALIAAVKEARKRKTTVLPIFVYNPEQIDKSRNGYASDAALQFIHESIIDLQKQLGALSGELVLLKGDPVVIAKRLGNTAHAVYENADYTPYARQRSSVWCIIGAERYHGSFEDYDLVAMNAIKPYHKFTPYWRVAAKIRVSPPDPFRFRSGDFAPPKTLASDHIASYFRENHDIAVRGGRTEALIHMRSYDPSNYENTRNILGDPNGTSRLSAYIKFGCISIREVYHHWKKLKAIAIIRELYWRSFYAHLIYNNPEIITKKRLPKSPGNAAKWRAWCSGETGVPLVDAGMRQLLTTGYMHNRARMVTIMYACKDMGLDWRWTERFFASHLVDYDPASNSGGHRWAASIGAESAPAYVKFNPVLQAKRYDIDGSYVREYANKEIPP